MVTYNTSELSAGISKKGSFPLHLRSSRTQPRASYAHRLQGVVATLKSLNADIILLQDVDFGCKRTQDIDVSKHLAEELGMSVFFAPEFTELYSPQRNFYSQGGGVIGNGN